MAQDVFSFLGIFSPHKVTPLSGKQEQKWRNLYIYSYNVLIVYYMIECFFLSQHFCATQSDALIKIWEDL